MEKIIEVAVAALVTPVPTPLLILFEWKCDHGDMPVSYIKDGDNQSAKCSKIKRPNPKLENCSLHMLAFFFR